MTKAFLAAAAAMALASAASGANAAISVVTTVADDLHGTTLAAHGQTMLDDFDAIDDARTSYVGNIIDYPGEFENPIATSAPPPYSAGIVVGGAANPVDNTTYASVQGADSASYTMLGGFRLTSFSFYMGSPDDYNHMVFHFANGDTQGFNGPEIWGGPSFNGDRTKGFRVYYDFGGRSVTSIGFTSDTNAFEYDGLAGALGAPEPAGWALMIAGFAGAGAMLRRRRAFLPT